MDNAAEEISGPAPFDAHYSYIRSLNNDLVLLGNALMTKNNDIHSIHDFVADSIQTLGSEELKERLEDLNERVIHCVDDEDRLRLLAEMQFSLASEALPYLEGRYSNLHSDLNTKLGVVKDLTGDGLKGEISRFQIDVLQFIPGIEEGEHLSLHARATEALSTQEGKDLNDKLNSLYEEINVLIQPSFDDDDDLDE